MGTNNAGPVPGREIQNKLTPEEKADVQEEKRTKIPKECYTLIYWVVLPAILVIVITIIAVLAK